jgi:RNA recognition motif-containing protein
MGKRQSKEEKNQFPSLYVDNLPKESFFDLDLYKFVTSKGHTLKAAKVVLDKRTGKSRGYGYLQFYT